MLFQQIIIRKVIDFHGLAHFGEGGGGGLFGHSTALLQNFDHLGQALLPLFAAVADGLQLGLHDGVQELFHLHIAQTAALVEELGALTVTACVDYDPAEGAAAVCGLDEPALTLAMNYLSDTGADKALTLAVGLPTGDGGRYVTLDGETTIYRMEEASLAQLLTIAETGL